jgi:outer membrane receptor for ferrienterochelin and colicins
LDTKSVCRITTVTQRFVQAHTQEQGVAIQKRHYVCGIAALLLIAALGQSGIAHAQSDVPPVPSAKANTDLTPQTQNGRQIYEAPQFARYAPQTALDMVRQIPGFSISEVSGDRGLGEASQNVLINGQRVTGKSNDAETSLTRIPVSTVIRLEIADGAAFGISGINGQVLNVVTKEGGLKGNFSYIIEARDRIGINPREAAINLSGKLGKGNFTLGLNNSGTFKGGGWGPEFTRNANGQLLYTRAIEGRNHGDRPRIAGSYSLKADNGNFFNVNAALEQFLFRQHREYVRFAPNTSNILEHQRYREDEWNYELGGDYELGLGKGRLKLIGFRRFEHSPTVGQFRSDFTNGTASTGQRFTQAIDEGEQVLRGEYRWKAGKRDWQISVEGALNYLDANSAFATLSNGSYQSVPLPGATARVEEKRAQSILTYGRPLTSKLSLQASIGGEYSALSQSGTAGLSRNFIRPKGSLALTWKASPSLTISSKLQRKVGQLSFGDFLASVDVEDGNNNASNPQLVPPQSWLLENEANLSLGKAGSIKIKLDGELISDLVDQIPLSMTEEGIGNLSSAKRLRGEIDANFVLDTIGFKGAKLDVTLALQSTSVRDPLLLTNRPISERGRSYWSIYFRHDIPKTQLAWGFSAEDKSDTGFYRLDYYSRSSNNGPFVFAFIEHKNVLGLKARLTLLNLAGQHESSGELYYVNRRDGPLDFSRSGLFRYGHFYRLSLSGTF